MIDRIKPYFLWVGLPLLCGSLGGVVVHAQNLVPPPPAQVTVQSIDGFSNDDRKRLRDMHRKLNAMHAKLFPLQLEDQVLRGGVGE